MAHGEKLTCPRCGADILYTDAQCISCGAYLDEGRLADMPAAAGETLEVEVEAAQPEYEISPHHAQPWDPSRMPTGGGFWIKLERGWTFLKQAMTMWVHDKDLLVPSILGLLNLLVFFGLCYWALYAAGLWGLLMSEDGESNLLFWILAIPLTLAAYIITYFYTGMTVNLIDTHLKGRDAKLGQALQDALKNVGGLISLAVLSTIVAAISSAVRGKGSRARGLAAEAIDKTWQAATYLILPIIIIEDVPLREAMTRAWELHRSRLTDVVVAEIGVTLVNKILGTLALLAAIGQGILLVMASPALLPVAIAIAVGVISFAMIFTSYLRTAYYTCLYLWAAAAEAADQPVAAPKPLAEAVA